MLLGLVVIRWEIEETRKKKFKSCLRNQKTADFV